MEQSNATKTENSKPKKPKTQPSRLKSFEIIQKNLAFAGITPNLANQSYPFNRTILFGFLTLGSAIYCSVVFIIYEADTFAEYTQSVYVVSLAILIILVLLMMVLKVKKLFNFIDCCEDFINTSEYEYLRYIA